MIHLRQTRGIRCRQLHVQTTFDEHDLACSRKAVDGTRRTQRVRCRFSNVVSHYTFATIQIMILNEFTRKIVNTFRLG